MWFFMGLVVICLTIIVLFRMWMDLRRQDQYHHRAMLTDQQKHHAYIDTRSRQLPKASLPDFGAAIERGKRLERARIRQEVRYWADSEKLKPTPDQLSLRDHMLRGIPDEKLMEMIAASPYNEELLREERRRNHMNYRRRIRRV